MFDHLAALADDDALLPLALDVNGGVHAQHLLGLLERIADHANGVRDLITGAAQDLLAHKLGNERLVGSVGTHVLGEPTRTLGQKACNGLDKRIDVEVLDRRRHDLIVIFHELVGGLKLLHDLCGVGLIGLGEHQDLLGTGVFDALGNPGVSPADRLGGINQKRDDIDIVQFEQRALVELGPQAVLGLVDTRGIDKDQLVTGTIDDGAHAAAGRLGHRRGDGDLFAIAGVEQRGLAGVGAADQRHEAAAETRLNVAKAREAVALVAQGVEFLVAHALKRIELLDILIGIVRFGIHRIQGLVVQSFIDKLHIVGHENPFLNKVERVGKYQQSHNRGGDGKYVYGGGGDILRTLCQRMELLGRQVDDRLHGGVAQLAVNHQATADDNRGPLGNVEPHDAAGNDGAHARHEHDLNVALGLNGGDEALHGVGERL